MTAAWWQFDEGDGGAASDEMAELQATLPDGVDWSSDVASIFGGGFSIEFDSAGGSVTADGFDIRTGDLSIAF